MSQQTLPVDSTSHPVWCPFCGAVLGMDASVEASNPAPVRCPRCGRKSARSDAVAASAWRDYHERMTTYAAALRRQAAELTDQARVAQAQAGWARSMAESALSAARQGERTSSTLPGPAVRATTPPQHPATRSPAVPMSVLLQGTGAVLLLAALTIASAVLWGALPAWLQAVLLMAMVAAVGALATWLGRRLPATGSILQALTAAAGVVVALALPRIVETVAGPWYPTAASAVGAAALLLTGRLLAVRLWWHAGLFAMALTAGLAIAVLLDVSGIERWTVLWFGTIVLLVLPLSAAALLVGRAAAPGDPETARTTGWIGLAGLATAAAAVLLAFGVWWLDLSQGAASMTDRAVAAAVAVVLAVAVVGLLREPDQSSRAEVAAACLLGAAPMLLVLPNPPVAVAQAVLCGLLPVGLAAGLAAAALRNPALRRPSAAAAAAMAAVGAAGLAASAGTAATDATWLVVLLWGTGAAVVSAGLAIVVPSRSWLAGAAVLMAGTWGSIWLTGHLGSALESLALPVGGFLFALWALGRARGLLPPDVRLGQVLILAMVGPTAAVNIAATAVGALSPARAALVGFALAVVASWSAAARSGWTVPVVGAVAVALGHSIALLLQRPDVPPEAFSVAVALSLLAVLSAGAADGWSNARLAVGASLGLAVAPSVLLILLDPQWSSPVALRLAWTSVALGGLVVLLWHRPLPAWLLATVAMVLPLWVYQNWLVSPELEARTLPVALVAGVSAALAARAVPGWSSASLGVRVGGWALLVPSLAMVLAHLAPASDVEAMRTLAVLTVLGLLTVLADLRARTDALAAACLLVAVGWLLVLRAALDGGWALEGITLPAAAALTLLAGWVLRPSSAAGWWELARWPTLAALAASTVWAVTAGLLPSSLWQDWARAAVVVAAWAAAAVLSWSKPWRAALFGGVGASFVTVQTVSLLVDAVANPAVELVAWPIAAGLAVVSGLVWRAVGRRGPSLLWVGPPTALVLLPSAALAWADGTAGWRVWFALLLGAAVLVVGVRLAWAGLVLPGLVAIAMVVVPVLLHYASDAPVWVPLTIVGAVLIAIGARLEIARREGHRLVDWAVHLH